MDVNILAREALDKIKSNYILPKSGFIAGGSIANVIWEIVSGNKAVINDIDVFIYDGQVKIDDNINKDDILFKFDDEENEFFEDYTGMSFRANTKDYYIITSCDNDGIINNIKYKSTIEDPSFILKSFDINCTQIGYSIDDDKFYWTDHFYNFIKTGELKVINLQTPNHTAIRIVKKSIELNTKLDIFELDLLSYVIKVGFSDISKSRFQRKYLDMFKRYENILSSHFEIVRDNEIEDFIKCSKNKEVELYTLKSKLSSKIVYEALLSTGTNCTIYFLGEKNERSEQILNINNSTNFLFYIRNIYDNPRLVSMWETIGVFYYEGYLDIEPTKEDLDLIYKLNKFAPRSTFKLKNLKISEQLRLIRDLYRIFKNEPIIAISILENNKLNKDIIFDEITLLVLELSVRKKMSIDNASIDLIFGEKTHELI